jgi:hypothetical protein
VLTFLQALLLPAVVRFARLPVDTSVEEERHLAEAAAVDAAWDTLDDTAAELGTDERVLERVRHELGKRRKLLAADGAVDDPVVLLDDQYTTLQLARIARERARCSSYATSSASMTSFCVRFRPAWTPRRSACPAPPP